MDVHPGELIVATMMVAFVFLGLLLATRGLDAEMVVFGFSLTVFAVAFLGGQVRRVFGTPEAAPASDHSGKHAP